MVKSIGLVFDRIRWEEKSIIESSKKMGHEIKLFDAKNLCLHLQDFDDIKAVYGDVILQRCMSYFRGLHLTAFFENKEINVINSLKVAQLCGNKVLNTLALSKASVPTPKTYMTFSLEGVFQAIDKIGYPAVLKPVIGSWGRLVAPLKDKDSTEAILESRELLNNPYQKIYYVQEMVDRPPRDIRTVVIGNRIIASIYRYSSQGDWRTNVARGGKTELHSLDNESEDIILKAAEAVGGGILGVDAMESSRGILVHEVNNTVEFKGAMSAGAINIPKEIINYAMDLVKK